MEGLNTEDFNMQTIGMAQKQETCTKKKKLINAFIGLEQHPTDKQRSRYARKMGNEGYGEGKELLMI